MRACVRVCVKMHPIVCIFMYLGRFLRLPEELSLEEVSPEDGTSVTDNTKSWKTHMYVCTYIVKMCRVSI